MEVVVLLVALVGIALVVIPRLQRSRAAGRRPTPAKARKSFTRRGRGARKGAAAPVMAAPSVASWTPPASGDDAWDDDLGWEGVDGAAPETRDAWEQWRATDSPLAVADDVSPEPDVAPSELPSVERWRAKAEEPEWEEDDDGLGWEGEQNGTGAPSPEPVAWSGNGNGNGNGHVASPETGSRNGDAGRDWTGGVDAPARESDSAPAFAAASMATDVAPAPELGRTISLEDDDWDPPVTQTWGAPAAAPAAAPAKTGGTPRRKQRTSKLHPVLLVAIYAAVGIGAVVLASTALLGGSNDPAPAKVDPTATPEAKASPAATPKPASTPAATTAAPATSEASAAEKAAKAEAAAQRKAQTSFERERSSAVREHNAQVSKARADARAEAKKRNEAKNSKTTSPSPSTSPSTSGPVATPVPTYTAPTQSGPTYKAPTPKRRCEFCIG